MSTKESNKKQKFRTPYKRKQSDNSCESPQVKRDKPEVNPLIVTNDNSMADNRHLNNLKIGEHLTTDALLVSTEEKPTDGPKVLVAKSEDFVFISAKGEERVVSKKLREKMANKFNCFDESNNSDEDNQLVPQIDKTSDQIVKEMLENDEFTAEWFDNF